MDTVQLTECQRISAFSVSSETSHEEEFLNFFEFLSFHWKLIRVRAILRIASWEADADVVAAAVVVVAAATVVVVAAAVVDGWTTTYENSFR